MKTKNDPTSREERLLGRAMGMVIPYMWYKTRRGNNTGTKDASRSTGRQRDIEEDWEGGCATKTMYENDTGKPVILHASF